MNLVAISVIERFGRRFLLMMGAIGQACAMGALAGLTADIHVSANGIAATVFVFVYVSFFSLSWNGIPW